MRELNECKAEIFRRIDNGIKERKRRCKHILMCCVPLCLCMVMFTSLMLPAMLPVNQESNVKPESTGLGQDAPNGPEEFVPDVPVKLPNGNVIYLNADSKTSVAVNGTSAKYTGNPSSSSSPDSAPPPFAFNMGYIHVVAKAVEELPSVYQTLAQYGSIYTFRYRVFKMEVINSLESGMDGTFYYALPENLKGDLTQYDALLISMKQRGKDFIMLNTETNELTSFTFMFCDPSNQPELGNMIAFSDNIFDESLWQDRSWIYGYQFANHQLDQGEGYDYMLVYRGSTLDDALAVRSRLKEDWGSWKKDATVNMYDFKTDAAKEAMAYIQPFENGVFVPLRNFSGLKYYRYIGGCPTNEWIMIEDLESEEVTRSEYSFTDADFENLPDIAAYIEALDLTALKPQHIDTAGKELLFNSAIGWYEKTADGVYSIVRIAWRYADDGDWFKQYYDETFIILSDEGAEVVSRDALIGFIGENDHIYDHEYGAEFLVPMA